MTPDEKREARRQAKQQARNQLTPEERSRAEEFLRDLHRPLPSERPVPPPGEHGTRMPPVFDGKAALIMIGVFVGLWLWVMLK